MTDYNAAERVVAQAVSTFGRLDVVVNNAGYSDLGSFEDTTIESFRSRSRRNFFGVVNVSKAVVPVLREQGNGHIFQVASLSVRLYGPGLTAYQASSGPSPDSPSVLLDEIAPFGVRSPSRAGRHAHRVGRLVDDDSAAQRPVPTDDRRVRRPGTSDVRS